jgi:hypothetical protein
MLTQAVRGRTGDRTSFRAGTGSLGHHDHITSVHVLKCVPRQSVAMFGRARLHAVENCMEMPIHTSNIDFYNFIKRTPAGMVLPTRQIANG